MRPAPFALAAAVAMAAPLAAPAAAEPGLVERNVAALLATLPEGAVLEVRVAGPDGAWATERWTGERYAAFRGSHAAAVGRDYTAAPESPPGGPGEQHYVGDDWADFWGTTTITLQVPRDACLLPRTIPNDGAPEARLPPIHGHMHMWLYGGRGSTCVTGEHDGACVATQWGPICSSSYGWTIPQAGDVHDDAWFAGWGFFTLFPPPYGAVAMFDGVLVAEDPA